MPFVSSCSAWVCLGILGGSHGSPLGERVPPPSKHFGVSIFWVVPAHGVAMDTSLPWPEVVRPPANIQGTSSQAHLLVMSLNVAKCNLGKVKIEPMLVAGCVLWGQRITPIAHVT